MKIFLFLIVLLSCVWFSESSVSCDKTDEGSNIEVKLKRKLLCNGYDKEIRPGKTSDVTNVNVRYTLKSFDYDDNSRTLSTTAWMTLSWTEDRLKWTASEYENIKSIHLSVDSIWIPDIYLYNSHISSGMGTCHAVDCLVSEESKVACVMPCEHKGHCKTGDYTNWPFDRQNCSFTFGSWMKSGEEMNYNTDRIKLISNRVKQNNQWKLVTASSQYNIGKYAIAPNETYPSLSFAFLIERHSAFHVSGTIVPALILLTCNLIVLWMMPGCIERFILCIVNLFSHTLYMEFLYWLLPHCGDSVPNVLIFFRDSQIITALLLVESIIMKTLIAKSDERPFLWIQSVVTFATTNRVGEFLLTPTSPKVEDAADLVESVKKSSLDENIWTAFCKLIDRILFFVFLIMYFIMFISLLPEGYLYAKFDSIETDS